jgi:cobalt-precorrin-5B (C1)-methyltransferase
VTFAAGEGVGTVTKPGLQVPPRQPAINPVPRQMIAAAIREITPRGVRVQISIPGGDKIAARTFNPRLGIEGGLSILGTTGIVRPYCARALQDALKCSLDVAAACGVTAPVLVPGNIGARAARRHFTLAAEQLVEVGNQWGFVLDLLPRDTFQSVLLLGHPGKLAKLAAGQWDTHSAGDCPNFRVSENGTVPFGSPVVSLLNRLGCEILDRQMPDSTTAEGLFAALAPAERKTLADALAQRVQQTVAARLADRLTVAVFLVNMAGECLGTNGDLAPWQ